MTIDKQTNVWEVLVREVTPGDLVEIVLRAGKTLARTKEVSATVFEVTHAKAELKIIERIAGYFAGWYRRREDEKVVVRVQPTLMEWTATPATYFDVPSDTVDSYQLLKKSDKNNGEDCDRVGWWTPAFP